MKHGKELTCCEKSAPKIGGQIQESTSEIMRENRNDYLQREIYTGYDLDSR